MIANPAPLESNIMWSGPTESIAVKSVITNRDAEYKYYIRGFISTDNKQPVGNYTMMYNGEEIITITIHAYEGMSFFIIFFFCFCYCFFFGGGCYFYFYFSLYLIRFFLFSFLRGGGVSFLLWERGRRYVCVLRLFLYIEIHYLQCQMV